MYRDFVAWLSSSAAGCWPMFDPYLELGNAAFTVNKLNAAEGDSEKHAYKLLLLGSQCHCTVQSINAPSCALRLAHDKRSDDLRIPGATGPLRIDEATAVALGFKRR